MSQPPLRVLCVTSLDLAAARGPSINERETVAAMVASPDVDVHLLAPRPSRPIPELPAGAFTPLEPRRSFHPLAFARHEAAMYRAVRKLLEERTFDLVVTRLVALPVGMACLAFGGRTPFAIKHLSGAPANFQHSMTGLRRAGARLIAPVEKALLRALARRAVAADCCTDAHRRGALRNYDVDPERVQLIDNATNTERFKPADPRAARAEIGLERFTKLVGYIGGRPWERGGGQLLDAAPALLERHPGLGFLVVGGGEGMPAFEKEIERRGMAEKFVLTGMVDYEKVPPFAKALDVGVAFDMGARVSVVGNANQKVRQYLACGKPVVSGGGGNEFLIDNALGSIVEGEETAEIVEHIDRWLSLSAEEAAAHAERASGFAQENLSTSATLKQRVTLWRRMLGLEPLEDSPTSRRPLYAATG